MLRTQRLKAGLQQKDLRALIPGSSCNGVSCVERNQRPPNAREILAYEVIFGTLSSELFPGLVLEIERGVLRNARRLHRRLAKQSSEDARRVRAFLDTIIARVAHRARPLKV